MNLTKPLNKIIFTQKSKERDYFCLKKITPMKLISRWHFIIVIHLDISLFSEAAWKRQCGFLLDCHYSNAAIQLCLRKKCFIVIMLNIYIMALVLFIVQYLISFYFFFDFRVKYDLVYCEIHPDIIQSEVSYC